MSTDHSLPVTIIAGYLGAGKTTLVNACLRTRGDRRIAVLVNDFGEVNIDAALLTQSGNTDTVLELAGGCVCCSIGSDLMQALSDLSRLHEERHFDHVLLETSGVALPLPLSQSIRLFPQFQIASILVLADGLNLEQQLADRYVADTVRLQLQQGDWVLLTKLEAEGNEADVARALNTLRAVTPNSVLALSREHYDCDWLLGESSKRQATSLLARKDDAIAPSWPERLQRKMSTKRSLPFESMCLSTQKPVDLSTLLGLLQVLATADPPLVRAKGLVRSIQAPDHPQLLQQVGGRIDLTGLPSQLNDRWHAGENLVLLAIKPALTSARAELVALQSLFD